MAARRTTRRPPAQDPARISTVIARFQCTPTEADFFRQGERLAADAAPDSFADLDEGRPASPWAAAGAWLRARARGSARVRTSRATGRSAAAAPAARAARTRG